MLVSPKKSQFKYPKTLNPCENPWNITENPKYDWFSFSLVLYCIWNLFCLAIVLPMGKYGKCRSLFQFSFLLVLLVICHLIQWNPSSYSYMQPILWWYSTGYTTHREKIIILEEKIKIGKHFVWQTWKVCVCQNVVLLELHFNLQD